MHEHLVEYALDSLDPVTTARLEAHVEAHPEARLQLDLIEQALAPLALDAEAPEPPPGLALRTLGRVAEHCCMLPAAPLHSPYQAPMPPRRWLRWPDGLVAALLLVLVGGLTMPFLARQWQAYHRTACANNMRELHASLTTYGNMNEGAFPRVESTGSRAAAGIFVPLLTEAGLLSGVHVACPGVHVSTPAGPSLAELDEIYRTDPDRYFSLVRDLAGGYAFSLGYISDGRLAGLRQDSGDSLPLLADCSTEGGGNSANHGGSGQNVLHVGGHVRWCVHPGVGIDGDNIYLNRHRRVSAGVCRDDSVLAPGDAQPFPAE